jgi:hypothetical protein
LTEEFADMVFDGTGGEWKPAPPGTQFDVQPKHLVPIALSTTNSTVMSVPAVGEDCTTNDCPPRGNAVCVTIGVRVPLSAKVTAVRFYSTAQYPDDYAVPVLMAPGTDRAWSWYDGWGENSEGTTKLYYGRYHNRSGDRIRTITLEVDWT